jgi:RNA polymerase nonessential primary-like sigma factor
MGVLPKTPRRSPSPAKVIERAPSGAIPPLLVPPQLLSPEEIFARKTVARHREHLDWAMHVPAFEPFFQQGLEELSLPVPRRGIGLRALVDSMMLESKKDLFLWVLSHFRGLLPAENALRLAEIWGLELDGLNRLEIDKPLSTARWSEFSDQLRLVVQSHHRRYKQAQQTLFTQHKDLPEKLSQRLVFDPAKRADACQEGCLGLLHAIDKVDDGPTPFSNYAQQWVTRSIRNYLLGERFPVHVPVNLASSLLCEANREAPDAPPSTRPERTLLQPRVSLDAQPSPDSGPAAIADEATLGPSDLLNRQEILRIVQGMINQLSDKQREVLMRRYGLGAGTEAETLINIAQSIGISHQQVSMREKRALEKLSFFLRPVYRELYG